MTREEIINGLQFTVDMFLLDPTTGETITEPRNEMDKTTIDSCKEAIKLLRLESCEDAVSRKDLYNALYERFHDEDAPNNITEVRLGAVRNFVKDFPSVTPTRKKGKWIGTRLICFGEFAECEVELIDGFVADNCHCSECGEELEKGERGIYCPNCGADMRGVEE